MEAQQEEKVKIVRYASLNLKKWMQEEKDSATLTWSTRGIYPRITVFTSSNNSFVNNKPNYDFIITAPFDVVTLQMFVNQLKKVCKDPNNTRYTIDCLNTKVENGVRTNEKYVQAKVHIGKDDNGVIYIAATEENKKKIKFTLLPNMGFFTFYDKDGTIIKDESKLSLLYTEAYIKSIETLLINDTLFLSKKEVDIDKPNIIRENKPKRSYNNELSIDSSKLQDLKKPEAVEQKTKTQVNEDPLADTEEDNKEIDMETDSNLDSVTETPTDAIDDFLDKDIL